MRLRAMVAALLVLSVAPQVLAVVLCAKPRGDGTYSTTVKIREACRPVETQLDPAALGLQGPAAAVVKDASGTIVGLDDGITGDGGFTRFMLRKVGTTTVQIAYKTDGFVAACIYFDAAGCTGQGYLPLGQPVVIQPGIVLGTTLYYGIGPLAEMTGHSYECGTGCIASSPANLSGIPVSTTSVPSFTPPFQVEIP